MRTYLFDLAYTVVGAFFATLAAIAGSAQLFDILTFDWKRALTTSASVAVLALIHGVAARFQGDKERARFTAPQR